MLHLLLTQNPRLFRSLMQPILLNCVSISFKHKLESSNKLTSTGWIKFLKLVIQSCFVCNLMLSPQLLIVHVLNCPSCTKGLSRFLLALGLLRTAWNFRRVVRFIQFFMCHNSRNLIQAMLQLFKQSLHHRYSMVLLHNLLLFCNAVWFRKVMNQQRKCLCTGLLCLKIVQLGKIMKCCGAVSLMLPYGRMNRLKGGQVS